VIVWERILDSVCLLILILITLEKDSQRRLVRAVRCKLRCLSNCVWYDSAFCSSGMSAYKEQTRRWPKPPGEIVGPGVGDTELVRDGSQVT